MKDALKAFGKYLFACLFGAELWQRIVTRANGAAMELAITWSAQGAVKERAAIMRLPWETMCAGERFLATLSGVAITRRVADCAQTMRELDALPKVLFVTGDLNDSVIRPGAEFLGLLRNLSSLGLDLNLSTHLLLKASSEKIRKAVEWFQPDVVHFICHGGYDAQGSYLMLLDDDKPKATKNCYGPALIQLLQRPIEVTACAWPAPAGAKGAIMRMPDIIRMPDIVVLNACSTAAAPSDEYGEAGQISSPLAEELIQAGVPVAIGMGGEISDRACRLFTRRFYEALLKGEPIEQATAQGRRAGIIAHGMVHPDSSLDWALPVLFLADGVRTTAMRIDDAAVRRARRIQQIAEGYAPIDTHPIFCGRLAILEAYNLLVASPEMQRSLSRNRREFSMLALPAVLA